MKIKIDKEYLVSRTSKIIFHISFGIFKHWFLRAKGRITTQNRDTKSMQKIAKTNPKKTTKNKQKAYKQGKFKQGCFYIK
jgi:hypothetical protein